MEQETELKPLVSVICLCYNHERFVAEAIESVLAQTYENVELVVVDDSSTDSSAEIIQSFQSERIAHIEINTINLGNCKAFNRGFQISRGEYIIDLAADDVLMPERIETGINDLLTSHAGVHFSNMEMIDEKGEHIRRYHEEGRQIPQGHIYEEVLARHFIGGASMMIKREVLESLGGYDENLAYEDFDFWVRSSRNFTYQYSPETLVKKRVVPGSMGSQQLSFKSEQLRSTFIVCTKALKMNRSTEEHQALVKRIKYEMRKAAETGNIKLANDYIGLLKKVRKAIRASS